MQRIWDAHGLQPHRTRTFKLSTDIREAHRLPPPARQGDRALRRRSGAGSHAAGAACGTMTITSGTGQPRSLPRCRSHRPVFPAPHEPRPPVLAAARPRVLATLHLILDNYDPSISSNAGFANSRRSGFGVASSTASWLSPSTPTFTKRTRTRNLRLDRVGRHHPKIARCKATTLGPLQHATRDRTLSGVLTSAS